MSRYRLLLGPVALIAAATVAGCAASGPSRTSVATAPAARPAVPFASGPTSAPADPLPATPGPVTASTTSRPVHLDIPSIGVSTDLEGLGVTADGALQSPSAWQEAGWFDAGVVPGDVGPAVIAGHVDSVSGPAVFYRLRAVAVGDTARVTRADGSSLVFTVDSVQEYPKSAFPTAAVYGRTSVPVLRLVTCTGDFDRAARSYVDNLVVSAHLDPPSP